MLSHHPRTPDSLSRRSHAQRRIRRTAGQRLFCNTNGCTTFLVPDAAGRTATCPICGSQRRLRSDGPAGQQRSSN